MKEQFELIEAGPMAFDKLVAAGQNGFYCGVTSESYFASFKGDVYLFSHEGAPSKQFMANLFGLLCDDQPAQAVLDTRASLKNLKDKPFAITTITFVEGPIHGLLYIPEEDHAELFQKHRDSAAAEDVTEVPTGTIH